MSLLALPSEIFQHFLSETVSYENFATLRLVHPFFNDNIRASADHLMRQLLRTHSVSDHVLSLHQAVGQEGEGEGENIRLQSLLVLHKEVATCIQLEQVLDIHREKFAAFPMWADVPAKGFGSMEAVLIFSAFQRELKRTARAQESIGRSKMVACATPNNDHFEWLKLDSAFTNFLAQLTVEDLQALMTIVNFCAVSTRFVDTILTSRYYFNDTGASDHWQNEQIGSALLAERILWRGPSWLANMLLHNVRKGASDAPVEQQGPKAGEEDHTMWTGSRAEAVRLTANGIARLLWKERAQRLELERQAGELDKSKTKIVRPELRVDPAVWRGGSSGGF